MRVVLDTRNIDDYRKFLAIKSLPQFRVVGHEMRFPDEYAARLGYHVPQTDSVPVDLYDGLFDYQRDITTLAIRKRRFAIFAACGLGKSLCELEFARHAQRCHPDKITLIVTPLMVVDQMASEAKRFFGIEIPHIPANKLAEFLKSGSGLALTHYEALADKLPRGNLGGLVVDESSSLKANGVWCQTIIRLGKGLEWKLAATGTPAPNDRVEYANHAVFLDQFPNENAFLARYFVNKGKTQERWEMKAHAVQAFYRDMSHWAIFLNNPATYGWKDNTDSLPPIYTHEYHVGLTPEQEDIAYGETGELFPNKTGGITSRSVLSQLAKGSYYGKPVPTLKTSFIQELVGSWNDSTIIWCHYNAEQDEIAKAFPDCANITGSTKHSQRRKLLDEFLSGKRKVLVSKPDILGFGLNLQIATQMVFSGFTDSWEMFHQAVKRANRVGSTRPLNVHAPITDLERPIWDNLNRKAKRIEHDTNEQERTFKNASFQW